MNINRDKVAQVSTPMMVAINQVLRVNKVSREIGLQVYATAIAVMDEKDRVYFRQVFDHIEREMHGRTSTPN